MAESTIEPATAEKKGTISLRGAVFIGIGSMVSAGIFARFGNEASVGIGM
jgi:hypothetical protein